VDKVTHNPGLYVFEKPQAGSPGYSQREFEDIGSPRFANPESLWWSPCAITGKSRRTWRQQVLSLAERMLFTYGDTRGMVESGLRVYRICESLDFATWYFDSRRRGCGDVAAYRLSGSPHG
jgi:(E)-4-hydroxy-3-methylbut-2-enyl-diphosphate synthase